MSRVDIGGEHGNCSTPEGILVGFTSPGISRDGRERVLLNARRHLGRVHTSHAGRLRPDETYVCSTPEGILVGFT